MAIDYDKLANMDYTAYDHSQDVRRKLDEYGMEDPRIYVAKKYENGSLYHQEIPIVEVTAIDTIEDSIYIDRYQLDEVTKEEFEEIMFDIWENAMKELEP